MPALESNAARTPTSEPPDSHPSDALALRSNGADDTTGRAHPGRTAHDPPLLATKVPASKLISRAVSLGTSTLLQLATFAVLARVLGPESFGVVGTLSGLGYVAANLSGFGLSQSALRLGARDFPVRLIGAMSTVRIATAASVSVLVSVVGISINEPALAFLAASMVLNETLSDYAQSAISGLGKQGLASLLIIGNRAVGALGAGLLVAAPTRSILATSAFIASAAISGLVVARCGPLPRASEVRFVLRRSTHFWVATTAGSLAQLAVPAVSITAGPVLAGYYAASNRLATPLGVLTAATLSIYVPYMTRSSPLERRGHLRQARRTMLIQAAVLCISAPAISIAALVVLGPQYAGALPCLAGIVIAAAISGISQAYQASIVAENRRHLIVFTSLFGALSIVASTAALGAALGVLGLGMAAVLTQAAILALMITFNHQHSRSPRL